MVIKREVARAKVAGVVGVSLAPVTPPQVAIEPGPPIVGVEEPPRPPVPPVPAKDQVWYFDDDTLRCKELGTEPISRSAHRFKTRGECQVALREHIRKAHITKRREVTVRRRQPEGETQKRHLSARVEELMKKRGFPKAVKEAIEKGLEQKAAPVNIERMIEKVAKTNVPDYILRRTLAKRIGVQGIVQYKVDTDKGTIVYENADENTANAILGMSTPTGEVIPLQIKVIQ
jgi:hypothetical protein